MKIRLKRRRKKDKKVKKESAKNDFETIVVQRLSSSVSGKAQKYSRVGAREFVPFEDYSELSIKNIREACSKYYGFSTSDDVVGDILATEQGPSCSSLKQLRNLNVIHVRFVDKGEVEIIEPSQPTKKRKVDKPQSIAASSNPVQSKFVPRSLSVVDMLKLGNVIQRKTSTVEIYNFNMTNMVWSERPTLVEFVIEPEPFGTGGFREAFKATSRDKSFDGCTWVIKKHLSKAIRDIEITGQTVLEHTKKVVQMHFLARNLTAQLKEQLCQNEKSSQYGDFLCYKKIYMGKHKNDYVTVEEFVEGSFDKYVNNDGTICGKDGPIKKKA